MPDEARDGRNVALIDKCFMVCSIIQRRIKLLDNLHWVCVANIGYPDNTVNIYDSLPAYSVG